MEKSIYLYTRYEHGGDRVEVRKDSYCYRGKIFNNASNLLRTIYGKEAHITFDRYFRQGRFATRSFTKVGILDLFTPSTSLGIDLRKRGKEVEKLFYAGFGSSLAKQGYPVEDVLQEVFKGLVIRNQGSCPYDPSKASFSLYVHMVIRCVISNFQRRLNRRKEKEVIGISAYKNGRWDVVDVSESDYLEKCSYREENMREAFESFKEVIETTECSKDIEEVAEKVALLLLEGHTQKEIRENLGISKSLLRRTLNFLRSVGGFWVRNVLH